MDENVLERLKESFSLDLFETVQAARKAREKVFRHTLLERDPMVFCAVFPKADLAEFPNMTPEFAAQLKTFNLVGVVTDGDTLLELFLLGGRGKPYTAAATPGELAKSLRDSELVRFMNAYFKARGLDIDLERASLLEFMHVAKQEAMKAMPDFDDFLAESLQKG